ncbi:MAG: hypothetical protein ABFC84_02415 [Veillonellales bacterium]
MVRSQTRMILIMAMLLLFPLTVFSAPAADENVIWIKGTVRYAVTEGTYGILSDKGKKYQPVRLSKEFRKDGLAVVCQVRLRDDLVGARMWGRAVEILQISTTDRYIAAEERQVIPLLQVRMEAFNGQDLAKLQAVDVVARKLSSEQFTDWIGNYGHFTLRDVEIADAGPSEIRGACLYSRELVNGLDLSGNVKYTIMEFVLNKIGDGWKFTATGPFRPGEGMELEDSVAAMLQRAKTKYGTDDLTKWPH